MSPRKVIAWELCVVLLLALVLVVEWWRAGELEDLTRRVDELELARRRRSSAKPKPAEPEVSK
jgi:hypothetical protein